MAALNGSVVLLKISTTTDVFTVVPCQTSADYDLSVNTRDTSCKDSPDDTNAPGSRSRSISVETLLDGWPLLKVSPATALEIIRKKAETGVQITGRIAVSGTDMEEFTATITSFSMSAPREDNVTMSLDLAISGAMTPVEES